MALPIALVNKLTTSCSFALAALNKNRSGLHVPNPLWILGPYKAMPKSKNTRPGLLKGSGGLSTCTDLSSSADLVTNLWFFLAVRWINVKPFLAPILSCVRNILGDLLNAADTALESILTFKAIVSP